MMFKQVLFDDFDSMLLSCLDKMLAVKFKKLNNSVESIGNKEWLILAFENMAKF